MTYDPAPEQLRKIRSQVISVLVLSTVTLYHQHKTLQSCTTNTGLHSPTSATQDYSLPSPQKTTDPHHDTRLEPLITNTRLHSPPPVTNTRLQTLITNTRLQTTSPAQGPIAPHQQHKTPQLHITSTRPPQPLISPTQGPQPCITR